MSRARTAFGVAALVLTAGCSAESPPRPRAELTIDGHKRSITSGVECTTTEDAAGNRITQLVAVNGVAQLNMSLSEATPPLVNGFGLALTSEPDVYWMAYQTVKKASDVHANRDGKSYKVSGTGNGTKPGPKRPGKRDTQELKFQVLVVCP